MDFACFGGRTRGKTCRKSGREPSWVGQVSLGGIVSSLSGWYLADQHSRARHGGLGRRRRREARAPSELREITLLFEKGSVESTLEKRSVARWLRQSTATAAPDARVHRPRHTHSTIYHTKSALPRAAVASHGGQTHTVGKHTDGLQGPDPTPPPNPTTLHRSADPLPTSFT